MDRQKSLALSHSSFVPVFSSSWSAFRCVAIGLLALLVVSCGGGGGGSSSSGGSGEPPSTERDFAPRYTSEVGLRLGAPTASPAAIPPSNDTAEITFQSIISGTETPEYLILDRVDSQGQVLELEVAQLRDNGAQADEAEGDRIYSGAVSLGSLSAAEMLFRVRVADVEDVTSQTGVFWVSDCPVEARPSSPDFVVEDGQGRYLFTNEVMVTLQAGTPPDLGYVNGIAAQANGRVVGCVPMLNRYLLELDDDNATLATVESAVALLEATDEVINAQANFLINTESLRAERSVSNGALARPEDCDGNDNCSWHLDRIRAEEAWGIAGGGNKEQGVAVIDFGVDCRHSELDCEINISGEDRFDHGTAVASLVGANNDDTDVTGIAWNSKVYPYNFVNQDSQYKMAELISRSISNSKVKVINISAATPVDNSGQILNAICRAIESGRLVVASSGNASQRNQCQISDVFPAKYNSLGQCENSDIDLQEGLLVVGAIDKQNNLAEWEGNRCSNTQHVDIFAPGESIYAAGFDNGAESYGFRSGTSYATPLVAGSAALLWASRPTLTPQEIHNQLISGASFLSSSNTGRTSTSDARLQNKLLLDLYQTLGGSDTPDIVDVTPDDFSFSPVLQAPLGTDISSERVTITGLNSSAPIRIENGYYAIDNGPFTNSEGIIRNNQFLTLRLTSAEAINTNETAQISIGNDTRVSFQVTTGSGELTLGNLSFPSKVDAEFNDDVLSIPVVLQGIAGNTAISIENGRYAINGGDFVSADGVISSGEELQLLVTAAAEPNTATVATLTLNGDQEYTFAVITEKADLTPDPFTFDPIPDGVATNAILMTQLSDTQGARTVRGINTATPISILNGEYSIDGGAFTREAGTIRLGQQLSVSHPTASLSNATSYTTVTVGNYRAFVQSTTVESAPELEDLQVPQAVQGSAVSGWRFVNNGGVQLRSCEASPTLPSGLNVSVTSDRRSCEISGVATDVQSSTAYTITATNEVSSATANVNIEVSAELAAPLLVAPADQRYLTGTPVSLLLENTGGANLTSCQATPGLPSGLSLAPSANQGSCEITGIPSAEQLATSYTITATNTRGSVQTTLTITVEEPPALGLVAPQNYFEDFPITPLTLPNTGGTGISACEVSPSLPLGLSLEVAGNGSTCVLSGTPVNPQVATHYAIKAVNDSGESTTRVSISIAFQAPNLTSPRTQTFNLGSQIALLFTNSGGGSLDRCGISPELPAGLSIEVSVDRSSCQISGVPTTLQGDTNYRVTASNTTGTHGIRFDLKVTPQAPNLVSMNETALVDERVTWVFTNTGGGSIYSCSTPDTLPAGYTLSITADGNSCQITGAESSVQPSNTYTVTAENAGGADNAGGSDEEPATITLVVYPRRPFTTTWKTDNPGFSTDNQVKIGTHPTFYEYNYSIDWGDGSPVDENVDGDMTHTYAEAGTYTITIWGMFPSFGFYDEETYDNQKLMSVEQWGDIQWNSMYRAFYGASNFVLNASDVPDLSRVREMREMFFRASSFDSDINDWDVSSVRLMSSMFAYASSFNQDLDQWQLASIEAIAGMFHGASSFNGNISTWDVSSVGSMQDMFFGASSFNPNCFDSATGEFACPENDIDQWDVSAVTDMGSMFQGAPLFNGDISQWNVRNVMDMYAMFTGASSFNQDISRWVTSSVTDMRYMFRGASSFNQPINTRLDGVTGDIYWDVSNVTSMRHMFDTAESFNQGINDWDVSSVTDMALMFRNAQAFNQYIGSWVTDSVTNMSYMFQGASRFNQNINTDLTNNYWRVHNVTDMSRMFEDALVYNQDMNNWDVGAVRNMLNMFDNANAFNGNILNWDVSQVVNMDSMFRDANAFNRNIGQWNVQSVRDMDRMFYGARAFDQDLGSWDVSSVTTMEEMFRFVSLNTANYDALLSGWAALSSLQSDVQFNGGNTRPSSVGQAGKDALINNFNWTVIDGATP